MIKYKTEDGMEITIDKNGETLPENSIMLNDEYYAYAKRNKLVLCNSDHEVMLESESTGYIPYYVEKDCLYAFKTGKFGETTYCIIDYNGTIISSEFKLQSPVVFGDLIYGRNSDYKQGLFNFDGSVLYEGVFLL